MKRIHSVGLRSVVAVILFALVLGVFAVLPSASFAAEKKYSNWREVASVMTDILKRSVKEYVPGDADATKRSKESIEEAYFRLYERQGFEKAVMGAISGKRGKAVEYQFFICKQVLLEQGSKDDLKKEIDLLIGMLREDAAALDGPDSGWITFFSVFGMTLREGLEAILVLGAIVAYLVKTDKKRHLKSVYIGAVLGVVFSILLAILFEYLAQTIGDIGSGVGQEIFEGIAMFIAVIVLFHVSNWMLSKSEAEAWSRYIKDKVSDSVSRGNVMALSFSAFIAVAREGAELILFFQAMRNNIASDPAQLWSGLLVATLVLAAVYVLVTKFSVKLPLKPFFIATSALMFVMCVSFLGKGVFELQEAGVIGRTMIEGFPDAAWLEWFGIYGRWENLVPQMILIVVTIVSSAMHIKKNRKIRAEYEANNK